MYKENTRGGTVGGSIVLLFIIVMASITLLGGCKDKNT